MVLLFLTLEVHVVSLHAKRDSEIPAELLVVNLGCIACHLNLFVISKYVKERNNCACYVIKMLCNKHIVSNKRTNLS
jgi:hypothetical protein